MQLTAKDRLKLKGVHPDLVKVVEQLAQDTKIGFQVGEGLRTLARQKQLVAQGASQTLRSRHLTGHAVDLFALINGKVTWAWPMYHKLAEEVKEAARKVNVPIEWGGDWKSFKDGPHWQLPWKQYP